MTDKRLKVTLVRSKYGRGAKQLATVNGLGLRKMRHTVELEDTPAVRGMNKKVTHLVCVEES